MTNDGLNTFAWDANGRPTTADSVTLTYDALGRMVEQDRSGAYTEIVYGPTGSKLALMNGQSLKQAFVPLPAGATAVYSPSGLEYYRHADWLGSSRLTSTPSRTVSGDVAYAPFGETYAASGSPAASFTGQNSDTDANLYDFMYREYGIQGRWPSPDPLGPGAFNLADPQSLNRYAYVLNNPELFIDPLGLKRIGSQLVFYFDGNCIGEYTSTFSANPNGTFGVSAGRTTDSFCSGSPLGFAGAPPPIPIPPLNFGSHWMGGRGNGGSHRGTSTPGAPQPQKQAHPLANCIANSGNEASLQGILQGVSGGKLGNGWFASAFLGNPISDVIQFLTGNGSGAAAAGDVVSAGAPSALRAVPNVSFSYTSTTVTATSSEFSAVMTHIEGYVPLGDIASGAADVLEGFGYLVQAPVDITAIGFGAVVCSAGPEGG